MATCFHTGCRPPRADQMVPGTNYGMFNDLGVYGVPRLVRERKPWDAVTAMRKMEEFTRYHLSPLTCQVFWCRVFIKNNSGENTQFKDGLFRSVGGYHFLYADTFLSREEFEEMFDLTAYELVRKKYHAQGRF